jgi:integrase
MSDVRIAPNIYRTPSGFRVYHREVDPATGRSKKVGQRFGPALTLPELEDYRDGVDAAADAPDDLGFTADARRYLALTKVRAMPSFKKREFQIETWMRMFGDTPRAEITAPMMNAALHDFRKRYSGSSCNKLRTALMSMYTELDGRAAANPVKGADLFEEAPMVARGFDMGLLTRIVKAVSHAKARARLLVLLWTGMDVSALQRLTLAHVSIPGRQYTPPLRHKGSRRSRTPRVQVPLPMDLPETIAAFELLMGVGALGATPQPFDGSNLWRYFQHACQQVEQQIRHETHNPAFRLPHLRVKDLRHSFGTYLYEQTGNLGVVAEMLQHAPGSAMTKRYALGAVPLVLRTAIRGAAKGRSSKASLRRIK